MKSHLPTKVLQALTATGLAAAIVTLAHGSEIAGPGWLRAGSDPLPQASREFVAPKAGETSAVGSPALAAASTAPVDADFVTDEIRELARGLLHDPLRILNYVRNQIAYEHYYGCKKGAAMTLLENSGNDFDQSALLVALLRESAAHNNAIGAVTYKYGRIAVFQADIATWLGVADVNGAAAFTVYEGGFPYAASSAPPPDAVEVYTNALVVPHVWVEAVIDGVPQALDPSPKLHDDQAGLNIPAMAGYSRSALLAGIPTEGYTSHIIWGSGIVGALGTQLTTLTTNFVASLKATQPNASVEQVSGARTITPINSSDYSTTMFFVPLSTLATWSEIPGAYASTVEFTLGTQVWQYPLAELRGRRLALVFGSSGSPAPGQLWLEDELKLQESAPAGTQASLVTTVRHPHGFSPHDQSDAALALKYKRSGRYALVYCFDAGEGQLEQRQRKLEAYRAGGLSDTSREVITEALNVTGLQWMRQTELAARLLDRASATLRFQHHRFGRMGQEEGFYVDVPVQYLAMVSRTGDATLTDRAYRVLNHLWSAMEHGVIEQEQGASYQAVSTVDMVKRTLVAGEKVARGDPTNWTTLVRPYLGNYDLSKLDAEIAAGAKLLLPLNGMRTVGQWRGSGYASMYANQAKMLISGDYFGGWATTYGILQSGATVGNHVSQPNYAVLAPITQPIYTGADPVDLASGAFLYDHTDLELGLAEPRGLSFSRHYSTRLRLRDEVKLGYGWLHNWHLRLTKRSATDAGLGLDNPYRAAPALVAIQAALDLYDETDARRWTYALLACDWAVEALLDNAVSVQFGTRQLQFIKLPGGAFLSPSGVTATLVAVGSGYELRFRHGNTIVFDAGGRGTTIRDPYNKALSIAYNGDGTVNTVTDCYNRVLTFSYTGGRLASVSDGTGRSVSFSQTGADLTGCTDPEGKLWSFEYPEGGHRLGRTLDPDRRVIVENTHDTLDRVKEQLTHGDPAKRWQLHYSGDVTIEFDPLWGYRLFEYDGKRRMSAEYDSSGRRTAYAYDGQDHRTDAWTPAGEHTTTTYDAEHNPRVITDPLLHTRQLFYDPQQRLDYSLDPRGKTTDYTFNAYHRIERVVSPEGVTTETTYYPVGHTHAGLVYQVRTIAPGGPFTTTCEYDSNGYVNKITQPDNNFERFTNNTRGDVLIHTDRRGYVTTFDYNKRRQLTFTHLPTVNGVSYVSENRYDNAGNLWKEIDRFGNTTTHTYSATMKLVTTVFADNETVTYEYDERDWLVRTVDHRGGITRTDYYADGRVWRVFDPLNRQRGIHTYDDDGRPWQTGTPRPDGSGGLSVSETRYTGRGEPWQAIDPLLRVTEHLYDENGNLRFRTNRRHYAWEFTYNGDNQRQDSLSPLRRTTQKRYDARGLLDTVREPGGLLTDFTPDPMGRVQFQDDDLGRIQYGYDADGRADTTTENGQIIDRDYDALGRLLRYQHGTDYTLAWVYHDIDPQNPNAFSLQYPDGKLVRYDFDARGRLRQVRDWQGRTTTYEYDNLGRLEWTDRPNGTRRHVSYDAAGQIVRIEERDSSGRLIALFAYPAYWDNGQVRREFALPLPPQFEEVSHPAMTFDDDDRLSTWNGQAVDHDANGNMTHGPLPPAVPGQPSPGMGSFGYDARNRLLACNGVSYTYDAENLRTRVTTAVGPTRWVVNLAGSPPQPLVRIRPDGTVTRYVWGLGLLYQEEESTGQTRTYHYDRRGSTVALSAPDGRTVTDRWAWGPYGEALSRSGSTDTPFAFNGFFGVQTDPNGLLYMSARYYNAETRRFVSADPLGLAASANFYWFADADPLSLADPFGLCAGNTQSSDDRYWQSVRNYNNSPAVKIAEIFKGFGQGVAAVSGLNTFSRAVGHYDLVANDWDYNPFQATAELALMLAPVTRLTEATAPLSVGTKSLVTNPGPRGFVLVGEGSLESAAVVRRGEFVNRAFDSRYGVVRGVSGPLGRSFSPGSGVPTTAGEAIEQRGLMIYNTNNGQQAIIYRATQNIPAVSRTSVGGSTPEVLIDPAHWGSLQPIVQFPVVR